MFIDLPDFSFEGSRLRIYNILITDFFVRDRVLSDAAYELRLTVLTVCDWGRFFRVLCESTGGVDISFTNCDHLLGQLEVFSTLKPGD